MAHGVARAEDDSPEARLPPPGERPLFVLGSPLGLLRYEAGRGLAVGDTGLRVGGYASLFGLRDEGEPGRFELDELSLFFLYEPHPRVHFYSELEFEDLVHVSTDGEGSAEDASFELERAFGDVAIHDRLNLRVGKFLTPVGRWNVIHAQPLVWTTSRPLVTTIPFDDNTTGAQVFGSMPFDATTVTYRLFGQITDALDPAEQPVEQERSGGARLEIELGSGPELGGTYLAFRSQGRWEQLGGLDVLWRADRTELHAEAVVADEQGASGGGWGGFAQVVREIVPRWFAVARYEYFDPRKNATTVHLFDVGAAFRPWPPLVLKAEYLFANRSSSIAEPGFKSSVSLLF